MPGQRHLSIKVKEAKAIPAADSNGKSDPYCMLTSGGQKKKTKTLEPKWYEDFRDRHRRLAARAPFRGVRPRQVQQGLLAGPLRAQKTAHIQVIVEDVVAAAILNHGSKHDLCACVCGRACACAVVRVRGCVRSSCGLVERRR